MRRGILLVLVVLGLLVPAGPARAAGAHAQGWWWVAHQSALPAPPAPPDVGPDDLLLQGGDLQRLLDPTAAPAPTAVAALRFVTPPGATVGRLVLQVGAGAVAEEVRAYATPVSWAPAQGGAMDDAPTPDLSRGIDGVLSEDRASLEFADIGALVREDGLLSLVLVAGATDRVVVHRPGPDALAVSSAPELPFVPPPAAPAPTPAASPAAGGMAAGVPVAAPVPAAVAPPVAPVLPATAEPRAPVAARREVADDARTRVVLALEAALLLSFFGLLGQGPLAGLGRRLGSAAPPPAERGVGRFRRAREGAPPRL